MKKLVTNAYILDMASDEPDIMHKDILIDGNRIVKIDNNIKDEYDELIDAGGNIVMPGLINGHTHLAMNIFRNYLYDNKLINWLEDAIYPVEEKLDQDSIFWNSCISCIEMIKSGTTTCNDMYFGMNKTVEAIEKVGLRANVAWGMKNDSQIDKFDKTREYALRYNYPGSRINVLVSADSTYNCDVEMLKACKDLAQELHTGIHIHLPETLNEERKVKRLYNKSSVELLDSINAFEVPFVIANGLYLCDKDIEILKKLKGGIIHNPISNCKLSQDICDITKLKQNGINVGLGTDGIGRTRTLDLFEEMKMASYLQKIKTKNQKPIEPYEILKMATIDGAKVIGKSEEIGSIEVGKKADLIFIDSRKIHDATINNICSYILYTINGSDVDTAIIDGEVILRNKMIMSFDEEEARRNAISVIDRV